MKPTSVEDIIHTIRTDLSLRDKILELRKLPLDPTAVRRTFKEENLHYFSFGLFEGNHRVDRKLISIEYLVLDADKLAEKLTECRDKLKTDPRIFMVFISPGGIGLKFVVHVDRPITSKAHYNQIYLSILEEYEKVLGVKLDHSTQDPSHACFYSYDPELYCNPNHTLTAIPEDKGTETPVKTKKKSQKEEALLSAFEPQEEGSRTHSLTKQIGLYIRNGFTPELTLAAVRPWNETNSEPLDDEKLEYTVRDLYERYAKDDSRYEGFWSYGTEIYEMGIVDDEFYMNQIGKKKFEVLVKATTPEARTKVFNYLVNNKHIPHLKRIDHIGDINAEKTYHEVHQDTGIITVRYAPVAVKIQDNAFIENYLDATFGEHKDFIKRYLAVYTYTNYRKLPFLVFTGERGSGKTKFAEAIAVIYPSISQTWHGKEKNFTPEVEKKLLIADESVSDSEEQYRMLKKYGGQDQAIVNQKFMKEYKVKNNLNVWILSNGAAPIFVQRDEAPTSEKNNQFFVFRFKPITGEIDPDIKEKLVDRLGYYVRTVLKDVFEQLDMTGYRYSIPVPITEEEKALFRNSVTEVEDEADRFLERLSDDSPTEYTYYLEQGYVPTALFNEYTSKYRAKKSKLITNLVERGYLASRETERFTPKVDKPRNVLYKTNRSYCHKMSQKMIELVTDIEAKTDKFLERLVNDPPMDYVSYLDQGYVPSDLFRAYKSKHRVDEPKLLANLVERGYLVSSSTVRFGPKADEVKTLDCHQMSHKLIHTWNSRDGKDKAA